MDHHYRTTIKEANNNQFEQDFDPKPCSEEVLKQVNRMIGEPKKHHETDYNQIFRLPKDVSLEILPSLMFTQSFREKCLKPKLPNQEQLKLQESLKDVQPIELLQGFEEQL